MGDVLDFLLSISLLVAFAVALLSVLRRIICGRELSRPRRSEAEHRPPDIDYEPPESEESNPCPYCQGKMTFNDGTCSMCGRKVE